MFVLVRLLSSAEFGGLNNLKQNSILAVEPKAKAKASRRWCFVSREKTTGVGGTGRSAHHCLALYLPPLQLILSVSSLLTWERGLVKKPCLA